MTTEADLRRNGYPPAERRPKGQSGDVLKKGDGLMSPRLIHDGEPPNPMAWPDPTPEMLKSPQFEAVWNCIRKWDINVPDAYAGYSGATGNHVRAILEALAAVTAAKTPATVDELEKLLNSEDDRPVRINPDGSITELSPA